MPEAPAGPSLHPAVFTIPTHRSFADSLAAGLIARFGSDPLALAGGRILLPNNRAVRSITEAFVRASGSGLVLPRLIPIGDPELEERIGGALDPADLDQPAPPAHYFGIPAVGVRTAEALRMTLETALQAPGPTVIEALVDPAHYSETVYD